MATAKSTSGEMKKKLSPLILQQGSPEWMTTFADMMTLLLTFFILLFAVSQVKDAGKVYEMIYALQGMMNGNRPVHGFLLPDYNSIVGDLRKDADSAKHHFGEAGVHDVKVERSEGDAYYSLRIRDQLQITIEGQVLFEERSTSLRQEGRRSLEKHLVPRFRDGPFRIVIRGHSAAGEGRTADEEDDLGYRRAREVRDFFVGKGIAASRFEIQTVGSRSASAEIPGRTDARSGGRRVEIYVSPQAAGPPIEAPSVR